jgi:hypothetical protein
MASRICPFGLTFALHLVQIDLQMKRTFILFLCLCTSIVQAQNPIGIPDIINYHNNSYSAGTENRSIVEDQNGVMYFANLEGLLSFDGSFWKLYSLPNKSIVRSIAMGKDNRTLRTTAGSFFLLP